MAAQLSWAGAALCCVVEIGGRPAQPPTALAALALSGSEVSAVQAAEPGHACEAGHCHCHHAGAASAGEALPDPGPTAGAAPAERLPQPGKSHIPAGLDRPNWLRA